MKKILVSAMTMVMCLSVGSGCGQTRQETNQVQSQVQSEEKTVISPVQIATLNGPTGMGMIQILEDGTENYEITLYQSADEIVGKIVSGEVDIACVPSNLGAVLYNKTQKQIRVLGVNTLGVLYILENGEEVKSIDDLRGKTIIASGKGSTPEYILNNALEGAGLEIGVDVTVKYMANHTDVVSQLVSTAGTIALLPQPHVTIAQTKNQEIHIAVDLNEVWEINESTELPMGIVIANNKFMSEEEPQLEQFITDYKHSVEFVNSQSEEAAELIAKHGIVSEPGIALKAIPNCNIVYREGEEAKESLDKFYSILYEVNPQAVGGTLPDESYYYSK